MAILNVQTTQIGQVGTLPTIAYISTNNTETEILATGFLNHVVQNGTSFQMPCIAVVSTAATPSSTPEVGWYQVSKSGANWSLLAQGSPGDVILPTIANHIATYTNTTGTLSEDAVTAINGGNIQAGLSGTAGILISFPPAASNGSLRLHALNAGANFITTIRNSAMGQSTVYSIPDAGVAASRFVIGDLVGTQHITTGSLAVDAGTLTSGIATGGVVGKLTLFPTTTANGSLIFSAVGNVGNFNTTISDVAGLGQSQVLTIPDVGAATGQVLVKSATLVSGNVVVASGTAGKVADGGFAVKANTTAAYAGGGTSNAFTATGLTASSIVTAVILASTNDVAIAKAVPSANTLTVTFTADPGAATTVSWIAITPAV